MKKGFLFMGIIALMALVSCKGNDSTTVETTTVDVKDETTTKETTTKETTTKETTTNVSDEIVIPKIENIDEDFILGMDSSCVPSLEDSGVKYYDFDGKETDVFQVLADNGINYIRVRIWNDPYDSNGNGYGGGNCDLEKALEIGKRVTDAGMKMIVNFHYSDFWSDPSKQQAPKEWEDYSITEKVSAVYTYTKESLLEFQKNNISVGMVQIGNETNGRMCGETTWANITALMSSGSKAVREVYSDALIALHFTNPEKAANTSYLYAKELNNYAVDYDVFATSYYPAWHGTISNLTNVLSTISTTYNKKVMVMETSYGFTTEDSDYCGNMVGDTSAVSYSDEPFTLQGQINVISSIIDAIVNNTTNGIGVCYWEGTWISVGGSSWAQNEALWDKYGSGWTTKYAASYDSTNYGSYKTSQGNAVDNQALFDSKGHPLESLKLFKQERVEKKEEKTLPTLVNGSFESGDLTGWTLTDSALLGASTVKEDTSGSNSSYAYNFWSEAATGVKFTLSQDLACDKGSYTFSIQISGGNDANNYSGDTIYAYVTIGDTTYKSDLVQLSGWDNWQTLSASFTLEEAATATFGIYVEGANAGTWGYIDNATIQ